MRFIFGDNHICTYCGEPADTITTQFHILFLKNLVMVGKGRLNP